ncbi:unnamed protein product [Phytophthora lilii]|uniref:Unnamed protein product n=1 Tax=Phytophthora lilii TaxID=2077276 RepID=A0A9W6Y6Z8_9STRA|nr:unnamed protein product [Phytophthora lilii]
MTSVKQWELCDGCALGKQTRVSYMPKSPNHAKKLLEVIHSDVCGPMQTIEGCRVLVLRTSNRSTQTGSIRTHADYATTDYATVDYATCGYKIVGTRWASTWRSLIG